MTALQPLEHYVIDFSGPHSVVLQCAACHVAARAITHEQAEKVIATHWKLKRLKKDPDHE